MKEYYDKKNTFNNSNLPDLLSLIADDNSINIQDDYSYKGRNMVKHSLNSISQV